MIDKRYNYLDEYFKNYSDTLVIKNKVEIELLGKKRALTYFYSTIKHNGSISSENFIEHNYLMNGIGTHWNPDYNITYTGGGNGSNWLMYCFVGDEILYADEEKALFWGIPNPTSILTSLLSPSTVNSKSENGKCFDLAGRRLAASPSKGVYIKNGKKVAR